MRQRRLALAKKVAFSLLLLATALTPARAQTGILFTGAGPVNRSMGGTAVATPLDGAGSMFWNPATMSALPGSSVDLGVELLYPQTRLSSSVAPSAFGPGVPPIGLSASDRGDNGVFALPTMALVFQPDDSSLSYGLGVFCIGGFGVNYPASGLNPLAGPVNPILTPQPPNGLGLGSLYSSLQVLELTPNVSVQVTDRLSIGGGPTLALANLRVDPLLIAAPNPPGAYPPGTHARTTWGGGFQLGAYYQLDHGWSVGVSYKSPQWMDSFRFQTVDQFGQPRQIAYRLNFPGTASVGVGYAGFDRWTLGADFRYVGFGQADGFQQGGFAPNGAVQGLGWRSVFAMSMGAQHQLTDSVSLRMGYSYHPNPIPDEQSSFNVLSPTIVEHTIYLGASCRVTDALSVSLAYFHCFENSIDGPLVTPFGAVPGSSIRNTTSADGIVLGATVYFGCRGN